MTEPFRDELRRALAADSAIPDGGFENRILSAVRERLREEPRRRGIRRRTPNDLETAGPPGAWVLVAVVLTVVVVAVLLLIGPLARPRSAPAHPAPTASSTATPVPPDAAVAHYRTLVDAGFAPLQQTGDQSQLACGARPTVNCRAVTVQARQAAQTFLDTLNTTSPPPGLEDAHAELIAGLRELIPAYDAQLAAIDSGDASQRELRTGLSFQIKAQKVYHGVADTDCWPKRTVQNAEGGLTWRCPS
jgi:hypothetical protein